jgi:hypothetical protein
MMQYGPRYGKGNVMDPLTKSKRHDTMTIVFCPTGDFKAGAELTGFAATVMMGFIPSGTIATDEDYGKYKVDGYKLLPLDQPVLKPRSGRGTRQGKLAAEDVVIIKRILRNKSYLGIKRDLAKRFRVSRQAIDAIFWGRTWKHIS